MQVANPSAVAGAYWQWQGHSIYYVQAGQQQEPRPPLLLVHGFGASTDHWRKNIAQLEQDYQVWAIDLLGFGRSAKPELAYSGNLWREQLKDFIEQVIGAPVVLAGNSLGGYVSLCVAAQYPEISRGLILLNSAGPFSSAQTPSQPNPLQTLVRSILLQPWASYLLFQYVRQRGNIRKTLEKVYLDKSAVTDQLVEDIYRPSCDSGAPQVFAAVFKTPQGDGVDTLLEKLSCPLLLIWGEADPWMDCRSRGAKFREHYPNLSEHYLKAGHCPHDEVPEQVNNLITTWLQAKVLL